MEKKRELAIEYYVKRRKQFVNKLFEMDIDIEKFEEELSKAEIEGDVLIIKSQEHLVRIIENAQLHLNKIVESNIQNIIDESFDYLENRLED